MPPKVAKLGDDAPQDTVVTEETQAGPEGSENAAGDTSGVDVGDAQVSLDGTGVAGPTSTDLDQDAGDTADGQDEQDQAAAAGDGEEDGPSSEHAVLLDASDETDDAAPMPPFVDLEIEVYDVLTPEQVQAVEAQYEAGFNETREQIAGDNKQHLAERLVAIVSRAAHATGQAEAVTRRYRDLLAQEAPPPATEG
jgi:hypothetical protein